MRLLPRFSLRFALIALTIFLIVFGVVASYWKRNQDHERVVKNLELQNCFVEEVPLNLAGFEVGKRLVGIQVNSFIYGEYLELIEQLPNLDEIRRFGVHDALIDQPLLERLLTILARMPQLEELYLQHLSLTREQTRSFARYSKLRVLDLSHCNIPRGGLAFLNELPELETLVLEDATYNINELYQIALPRLKHLNLSGSKFKTLELTKDGWGHFPNLETLVARRNTIGRVTCEVGAMPRLKHLDLGNIGEECQVVWEDWPLVMPRLVSLAMPTRWFDPPMLAMLEQLPELRYLYLDDEQDMTIGRSIQQFNRCTPEELKVCCPARLWPALQTLYRACPDLLLSDDYNAFLMLVGAQPIKMTRYLWSSPHWRPGAPVQGVGMGSSF